MHIEKLTKRFRELADEIGFDGAAKALSDVQATDDDGEPVDVKFEGITSKRDQAKAKATAAELQRAVDDAIDQHLAKYKTNATRFNPGSINTAHKAMTKADNMTKTTIPSTALRGTLKNFTGERTVYTEDAGERTIGAEERAYRFGMYALDLAQRCLPGRYDFPKAASFAADAGFHTKGHIENANPLGGYLVPDEFQSDLIDLREQFGVARQLFKVRPMASDTRTDPRRTGGLTAYAVGESQAGTKSTKTWDRVRLTARKWMVLSKMSAELNEDAVISLADDLAEEIAYAFSQKEDDCAFNGDGGGDYHGIVGVRQALQTAAGNPSGTSAGGIIVGSGNAYSELTLDDFHAVQGALPEYAERSPAWVVSRPFYFNVMQKLMLASGGVPAAEVAAGGVRRFLGDPVIISQVMPKTAANDQLAVLYGDFRLGASFGDRRGTSLAFSESAMIDGENSFQQDEIAIRGTTRWDINVHDVGSTTEAGPIVGLQLAAS
ncbi:MAG: phage major capsid protein [Planctomycetota bacterium]